MGYFSRIVEQSGLRVSEKGEGMPGSGKAPAGRRPLPLEREETVFVSPPGTTEIISNPPEPKTKNTSRIAPPPDQVLRTEQIPVARENIPVRETERFGSGAELAPESVESAESIPESEGRISSETTNLEKNVPAEKQAKNTEKSGKQKNTFDGIHIDEQVVFTGANAETEAPSEPKKPGKAEIAGEAERPGKAEIKTAGKEIPAKINESQYFVKTVESIERGDLSTDEIQNIVFQEVLEWAADPPAEIHIAHKADEADETEAPYTSRAVNSAASSGAQKTARANPEAAVIRIANKKDAERIGIEKEETAGSERGPENTRNPRIEEQSFELSIGTINVVIENGETPQQQILTRTPDHGDRNASRKTERPFSRLSRNYL